jgi:hypothetical protein
VDIDLHDIHQCISIANLLIYIFVSQYSLTQFGLRSCNWSRSHLTPSSSERQSINPVTPNKKRRTQHQSAALVQLTNQTQALANISRLIGNALTLFPIALLTAFAVAAVTTAVAGSPIPPGFSVLATKCVSINGVSAIRITG